jgi:predicted nucleic acid-binding protein
VTTPSGSKRYIVDSSGWVEFLGDGPKADGFEPFFEDPAALVLPTIVVYEVFKKLLRTRGISAAEQFYSRACELRDNTILLDTELAVRAARLSLETNLPMADAIIYATAQEIGAQLVTADAHFSGLSSVTLI